MLTKEQLAKKYGKRILNERNLTLVSLGSGRFKGETRKLRGIWNRCMKGKTSQAVRMIPVPETKEIVKLRNGHIYETYRTSPDGLPNSEEAQLRDMKLVTKKTNWRKRLYMFNKDFEKNPKKYMTA